MAFKFSELLHESIDEDSIAELCAPYCDPEMNQLGMCPDECIHYCFPTCYLPIFGAAIPPLPPDIINKPLVDYSGDDQRESTPSLTALFAVLAILLFVFICYGISKAWNHGRTETSGRQQQEHGHDHRRSLDQDLEPAVDHPIWHIRSFGLQSSAIRSIPICKYKKGQGHIEGTECAVCLNEFQEDETLRLLPNCKHAFHIPCIDKWLGSHTNCPLCRDVIVINQVGSVSPEQSAGNTGLLEEISQEGVAENQWLFESGVVHAPSESSIQDEAAGHSRVQIAIKTPGKS